MRIDKNGKTCLGDVMSNFDHRVNEDIKVRLSEEDVYADYSAWNFHGTVWQQDELYHCEIWQYKSYQETISAETLEKIMEEASSQYGSE